MNKKILQNLSMVQSIGSEKRYKRPPLTKQEMLSYDQIKKLLKNYIREDDIGKVPLGTHIRYIEQKLDPVTNTIDQKFRLGGYLINNKYPDKYIVLSNGSLKWSVQVKDTIFFKSKLHENEQNDNNTEDGLEKEKLQNEITKLKELIVEQELTIKKLKEKVKELKQLKKKS